MEKEIIQSGKNVWFAPASRTIFTVVNANYLKTPDVGGNEGKEWHIHLPDAVESDLIWTWGANNVLPQRREQLVAESGIAGELLNTKQSILLGAGLVFFRKIIEGEDIRKEYVEEPAWYRALQNEMDMDDYFEIRSKNLLVHANMFTSVQEFKVGRRKVKSLKALESRHIRTGLQDEEGFIREYFFNGNWERATRRYKKGQKKVDSFLSNWPTKKYPNYVPGKKKQRVFILHCMDKLIYDDYYASPAWWGARKWYELANKIPVFHLCNLENGYLIRYHVEMPKDYFLDKMKLTRANGDKNVMKQVLDEETAKREAFMERVNEMLAGAENAGRALFTEYEINKQMGKEYPGIKITPIETDIKDEALLKLFERSNDAATIAQGIHPAVANIQVASKLSSGSEIANAARMYTNIKTPKARRLLLKDLNLVKKMNGTAEDQQVHIGFRDLEITDMSVEKTGRKEQTTEVE